MIIDIVIKWLQIKHLVYRRLFQFIKFYYKKGLCTGLKLCFNIFAIEKRFMNPFIDFIMHKT